MLDLGGRWLLECRDCGVRCTDAYDDGAPVRAYYSAVRAHQGKLPSGADEEEVLAAIAAAQAGWIDGICPPRAPGRFLEVGCNRGHLLQRMEALGWDVAGVDVSEPAVALARARCRGVVRLGEPENLEGGQPFDRIAMFDVLAHLPDPVRTLRAVARLLAPGGDLVLSTVDESWPPVPLLLGLMRALPRATRRLRAEMYEGQHYCYFGRRNVGRLLLRAGMEAAAIRPLPPLSARFFLDDYPLRRRLALASMGQVDRLLGSSRKMLVRAVRVE